MIIINTAGYLAEFMADAIIALPFCIAAGRPAALSQRQSYLYPTWLAWSIRRAYPL